MPTENNSYDSRERMRRLEGMAERNLLEHERIDRNISNLHASLSSLKDNKDKLVTVIHDLVDPIPPENLR